MNFTHNNRVALASSIALLVVVSLILISSPAETKEYKEYKEKKVHVVHVPKPVYIKKPYPVIVEKKVPLYKIKPVYVPKPIIVKKKEMVPVIKKVHIIKKVKVPVIKKVPYPVEVKKIKVSNKLMLIVRHTIVSKQREQSDRLTMIGTCKTMPKFASNLLNPISKCPTCQTPNQIVKVPVYIKEKKKEKKYMY